MQKEHLQIRTWWSLINNIRPNFKHMAGTDLMLLESDVRMNLLVNKSFKWRKTQSQTNTLQVWWMQRTQIETCMVFMKTKTIITFKFNRTPTSAASARAIATLEFKGIHIQWVDLKFLAKLSHLMKRWETPIRAQLISSPLAWARAMAFRNLQKWLSI